MMIDELVKYLSMALRISKGVIVANRGGVVEIVKTMNANSM